MPALLPNGVGAVPEVTQVIHVISAAGVRCSGPLGSLMEVKPASYEHKTNTAQQSATWARLDSLVTASAALRGRKALLSHWGGVCLPGCSGHGGFLIGRGPSSR